MEGAAFSEPAILRRKAAGSRNTHGEWVPGAPRDTPIKVATAPSAGNFGGQGGTTRLTELEGVRSDAHRVIWTATPLIAASQETAGDLIVWGGREWQVTHVNRWSADHYEAEIVRQP